MLEGTTSPHIAVCIALTRAIGGARTLDDVCRSALDALADGLPGCRASVQLFDADGAMRVKAVRGLSDACRTALEGYTPWTPSSSDADITSIDVRREPALLPGLRALTDDDVSAVTLIPLVGRRDVLGQLGLYDAAHARRTSDELQLAALIAAHVAFAVDRFRTEQSARRSEERLRFALEAVSMGTWEWDLAAQTVKWSDNLESVHGLRPGTFDGTFESYRREIHPDDRDLVLTSIQRAIQEGVPHDVEYRIVAPDGTVRWVEGKGQVEYENGQPVRMSGICMMVSRRKEAELSRLVAAEEASRLKDEFLATLSHELRTPLNAILGWVQMMQGDRLTPESLRRAIDVIGRNARLQAQLIDDILDVSRIITGKLKIDRRPLMVPRLVDNVLSGVLPAAEAKRIRLSCDIPVDLPAIDGDPKRLEQVLGNIVSNAIKFTPEGGLVHISCAADENMTTIQVRDSGIGISPEFLPFVFDRFRQADSRMTRSHGGLGLGLAIARHLIALHDGTITVHSEGPGRGSTFEIRLPSAFAHRAPAGFAPPTPTSVRLEGRTVLVVDDHADSRDLLAELLGGCGAAVHAFSSAASTLQALGSKEVDLLVADLGMPDIDGYELIEQVRRIDGSRGAIPAIAVSAYSRPEDCDRALAAGYNAYCPKPVDTRAFLQMVDLVLRAASVLGTAQARLNGRM
jgi:PAS domain S-box-containing protein